ncbi:MAG TPA: gluconate 2-dehydrogenase subunit 3 family protein [Spirillospora sp.]|nr:gluconate 2-dehydrogenase subunit 3 family protein [Spirillospora sp.]
MFSEGQIEILQAVVNRMIPPDDWPGGWEAGVGDYLFRQFERDLKGMVGLYQQGLDALEAEAQAAHGAGFARLSAEQQDMLLMQAERGTVQTTWPLDPPNFITMLAHHCAEGFYSDPDNGGNRDQIAWRMIGFEVRG